jgi:ribonucleoside-diphosphate reductase alpha chain
MNISTEILSNITVYMKYAKYLPEKGRRETYEEIVDRNIEMHKKKYPDLSSEIEDAYKLVYDKKVLPSMRSMQFAGKPIDINPTRIYNCSYLPIDDWKSFHEVMFLLLSGVGVGYSVQFHHVDQLPDIQKPNPKRTKRFLIGDSIEGWADAVKVLMKSYFRGGPTLRFDYSDIRSKGELLLTSGGKAPGPKPLRECLVKIDSMLNEKETGDKLSTLEVHDIVCHIADAVLAGGIRRAALISLFSANDSSMLGCKSGNFFELNPQRGRANNSAVLVRHRVTKDFFMELWERMKESRTGEPGVYFTNDKDWGCNPCCEIALRPYQFCNLTEVNVSNVDSQEDLNTRVKAAAFIGTLQAGYTDFHYLRPVWRATTEKDALIGVSMTGIASMKVLDLDLKEAAEVVKSENARVAKMLGIRKAARTTCVKPAGTTSLVLGTSSGIHAWHNPFYIRRIRVGKNEAIYSYLNHHHKSLVEDDFFTPKDQAVISVPQRAPDGARTRHETATELLDRVKRVSTEWVRNGHRHGNNTHNVSATISIRDDRVVASGVCEWDAVAEWMWTNKEYYNGLSVLPYNGGIYRQAPFEDITQEGYNTLLPSLTSVDLSTVYESADATDLKMELACVGGASCEIT